MRTIIAGSRDLTSYQLVEQAVARCGWIPTEVLSGGARGIDRQGEVWASRHDVPVKHYPAKWDLYGKSAGYRRNEDMARNADALVAIWDGCSKGTGHMIDIAHRVGLTVYVHEVGVEV